MHKQSSGFFMVSSQAFSMSMSKPFTDFITSLGRALEKPLPGTKAQFKMAPYERVLKAFASKIMGRPKKESAVLCLFYPKHGETYFALILRNTYKGVHSAQIGFPGGKVEETDDSLEDTALRETEEEVGIKREQIEIIGRLTEVFIPPSGFQVHPFVGFCKTLPDFEPNPDEVSKIIETPLSTLMDESNVGKKKITVSAVKLKINYPFFDIEGETVWGATAMMLSELKEMIRRDDLKW